MQEEIWAKVDEGGYFEGLYEVSTLGRWRILPRVLRTEISSGSRTTKEKIILGSKSGGYLKVGMKKDKIRKQQTVHIFVATCFIPNPENKPTVNHKDGNKTNNNVTNLEWATYSEQATHANSMGLIKHKKGEDRPLSKLTKIHVKTLRDLHKTGKYSRNRLAKLFGIASATAHSIIHYKSWKHVA